MIKMVGKLRTITKACCLAALVCTMTGCLEKDLYDGDHEKILPPKDNYFDFDTKSGVTLRVDYDIPGYKALIEVYNENPMEFNEATHTYSKKEGLEAIFKTYTDDNCKFEGTMNIPASLEKVYLYTREMGLPECVAVDVTNNEASFDASMEIVNEEANTRSYDFNNGVPYLLNGNYNLYSLCKWEADGRLFSKNGNRFTPLNKGYISEVFTVGNEGIGTLVTRLKNTLWKGQSSKPSSLDNSKYIASAEKTNVYISPKAADGTVIVNARLDVVFIHERAGYNNTFGYYYYKGTDYAKAEKYVVFPNVTLVDDGKDMNQIDYTKNNPVLKMGYKVRLKYFGEDGKSEATEAFPAGYTVGWFVVPDGYNRMNQEIEKLGGMVTTNDTDQKYITLYDKKSQKLVIGVEDGGDKSYEDLLFYVEADPMKAIVDPEEPGRPTIPDEGGDIEQPDETETTFGTLAFEDIWPSGGDYDLNDVVVEYKREVTFDSKNNVKKIVDTFTPVHDGATYTNAFAYQIDPSQMGRVTLPAGAVQETTTNSIVLFANAKTAVAGKGSYVVTREFEESAMFPKKELKSYNPYIIVNYAAGAVGRTEVHLPKQSSTSLANSDLDFSTEHPYFIDKDGKYPFAIDLPILNFTVATESFRIDNENEYPSFATWVGSDGQSNKDWYKNYKGGN